jgi:hypothetical protein
VDETRIAQVIPRPEIEIYNRIFERLIDDNPEDEHILVGVVAYFYYKAAKREWIEQHCGSAGKSPSDSELKAYISSWTDSRIDGVRAQANAALTAYAADIIEQERPKIVEDTLKHRSFWREAWVACFGAGLWTVVLIVFAVILKLSHIYLEALAHRLASRVDERWPLGETHLAASIR